MAHIEYNGFAIRAGSFFKTVVCSLLGVPLIGVFQQPTARILSMFSLELWTQKISLLLLSATGSLIGSYRPIADYHEGQLSTDCVEKVGLPETLEY